MSFKISHWLTLIALAIIWGASYLSMKKALVSYTPAMIASVRLTVAGIAFLPYFVWQLSKIRFSKSQYFYFAIIGLSGTAIPAYLYANAIGHTGSALGGILNAMSPIFTMLLGTIFFATRLTFLRSIGVFVSFIGVGLLVWAGNKGIGQSAKYWAIGLILLATILYGISANTVQKYCKGINPVMISAMAFGISALVLGIPGMFVSSDSLVDYWKPELWYLLYLGLIATVLAGIVFYKLLNETDAVFATSVSFLIPITSSIIGILDGESIGILQIMAMICILYGLYLARK